MSVFEFDFELPLKMPLGKKLKPVSPSVILFSAKPPKTTISPLFNVTSVTMSRFINVGDNACISLHKIRKLLIDF